MEGSMYGLKEEVAAVVVMIIRRSQTVNSTTGNKHQHRL
jgi:hypothetical protein